MNQIGFFAIVMICWVQTGWSANTFHLKNPWKEDLDKFGWSLHITGGGSSYLPGPYALMTPEGGEWYSYEFDDEIIYWWDWQIQICPLSDENCSGGEMWTGTGSSARETLEFTFGEDHDIWLRPLEDGTYEKTLVRPKAKVIWFQSPWGNRLLPSAIFGKDTVKMLPAESPEMCGWFYSYREKTEAWSEVQFLKTFNGQLVPAENAIDLQAALELKDTVFVRANGSILPSGEGLQVGQCFDKTLTIHTLNPFADSVGMGSNGLGAKMDGSFLVEMEDSVPSWFRMELAEDLKYEDRGLLLFGKDEWGNLEYPYGDTLRIAELFSRGVYEVWLFPEADTLRVVNQGIHPQALRFFNPWEGFAPQLVLNGVEDFMHPVENHCGWFEQVFFEDQELYEVYFKTALGNKFLGAEGVEEAQAFSLKKEFAVSDTLWLFQKGDSLVVQGGAPDLQGPCAVRDIAFKVFDQHEDQLDFERPFGCADAQVGLLEAHLGDDGLPVAKDTVGENCLLNEFAVWYKPQEIVEGYTNETCRTLSLALNDRGLWGVDYFPDFKIPRDGFFPLDDFAYLDSEELVPNPNFSQHESVGFDGLHNFHFTTHLKGRFQYLPGQSFEIDGDDDLWVFIDQKLVVDLGGIHEPMGEKVLFDTLALTVGENYTLDIFHAERNVIGSNLSLKMNFQLHPAWENAAGNCEPAKETTSTFAPFAGPKFTLSEGVGSYSVFTLKGEKVLDLSHKAQLNSLRPGAYLVKRGTQVFGIVQVGR